VESDFAAAQVYLRRTRLCLRGSNKVSEAATEALNLLIVAVLTADFARDNKNVILFRGGTRLNARRS
jgi:hypothetical protein